MLRENTLSYQQKQDLAYEAAQEAAAVRDASGLDQDTPISIYDAAEATGTIVRFLDINMEGIYEQGPPSRLLLSPHRPLARRAFNCAHELGHHCFGHGSTIDELKTAIEKQRQADIPEEVIANAFAAHILMPAIGIERAFNKRNLSPATASPLQIYSVACDFGVGYNTLLTHLALGLDELSLSRLRQLQSWGPQDLRHQLIGRADPSTLVVLDQHGETQQIDIEVDFCVVAPSGSSSSNEGLVLEQRMTNGDLFRAMRRGLTRLRLPTRVVDVRIMPKKYVGLARFRFLEDDLND
jgi:hypothetical protein